MSRHDPVVYFARIGDHVKIGWTTNLDRRLAALSIPARLCVLTLPGGSDLERTIHRQFAAERIEGSEWFQLTPRLRAFIAAPQVQRLVDRAEAITRRVGYGSASLLQREMRVRFDLARSLLDELTERGVVGPPNGSTVRPVLPSAETASAPA